MTSTTRTLIAGEGGGVLVAAATMPGVEALACEGLAVPIRAPSGVVVYPMDALPESLPVDEVVLVPSEPATVNTVREWAKDQNLAVVPREPEALQAPGVRVVAVSALSTGSGKTAATRRVVRSLRASGIGVSVARHPIANLLAWDRFGPVVAHSPEELLSGRPLEEREELAPLVGAGIPVATGLDPFSVLEAAVREAGEGGVVVWDGGGAAAPWITPDVHIVVVDLLRSPREDLHGRISKADVVVLAKADSAEPATAREVEARIRSWNTDAPVLLADLSVGVAPTGVLADRAVVCVEDWSAMTLGGLKAGAGAVAARRFRCGMVDPRPFAVGAIRTVLERYSHIGPVIPSLGRTESEMADLAASVLATPGEVVLWASNGDPRGVIPDEARPIVRAFGELVEVAGPSLQELLAPILPGAAP